MSGNLTGGVNAVPMKSADVSSPRRDFKDCLRKALRLDRAFSRSARGMSILGASVRKHRGRCVRSYVVHHIK